MQQMPGGGGGWACLELTEPLSRKVAFDQWLGILHHILLFLQTVLLFGHYFHKSKPLAY